MARDYFCMFLASSLLLIGCVQANVSQTSNKGMSQSSENKPETIWKASAILRPVDGSLLRAGGFMEIDVRNDLTFVPSLRLNLPGLSEGHYEAWLSRDDAPDYIKIGPLIQEEENGSYYLGDTIIKLNDDLRKFNIALVMIGEEPVLKGKLIVVSGIRLDGLDELFGSFGQK